MGNSTPVVARTSSAALAALCVLVAACGGGGGGGGPPAGNRPGGAATLTTSTAPATASSSYSKARGITNVAGGSGGSARTAQLDGPKNHLFDVRSFARRQSNSITSNPVLDVQLTPDVTPGDGGGTVTTVVQDNDNDGALSSGDTATLTFLNYQEDDAQDDIINGTVLIDEIVVGGEFEGDFSFDARFTYDLTIREPGSSTTDSLTAVCSTSEDETGGILTMQFLLVDEDNGLVVYNLETENLLSQTGEWTLEIDGYSDDDGDGNWFYFHTDVPFAGTGDSSEDNPTSGVLVIEDQDGSCTLTAQSDGLNVRIQVDVNGDGTLESDTIITWAALDALSTT